MGLAVSAAIVALLVQHPAAAAADDDSPGSGGRQRRQGGPWRLPPGQQRKHGGGGGPWVPPGHMRRQDGDDGAPVGFRQGCTPSLTTMNGGQQTCSGQLIFEDNFNDLEQWTNDVHMAGAPDFEFAVYKASPRNIFIENGIVSIEAFLTEDRYGPGFVSNGTMFVKRCTSSERELCERTAFSYNILPPVRSARVHTANTFTFRYGVVEMRVRGPRGDWLYPQLSLKPAESRYGPHYSSGEIRLPSHVGNKFLRETAPGGGGGGGGQRGGWRGRKLMRAGVALGVRGDNDAHTVTVESRAPQEVADWSRVFHVVRMKWAPDGFEFWVDGESMGRKMAVPQGGYASLTDNPAEHAWAGGESNAPSPMER